MGDLALGVWGPLGLEDAVKLFAPYAGRWWISGGLALEIHLGRSWREHEDSDVGIRRGDVGALRDLLAGWDVHVAAAGALTPWTGFALSAERNQNNLWARRAPDEPWAVDVTIGEGDEGSWIYRRDPTVRVSWDEAVLRDAHGIPYLAPELQLLFKSKDIRPKDDVDARRVIPELSQDRIKRLRDLLSDDHPWQQLLD